MLSREEIEHLWTERAIAVQTVKNHQKECDTCKNWWESGETELETLKCIQGVVNHGELGLIVAKLQNPANFE